MTTIQSTTTVPTIDDSVCLHSHPVDLVLIQIYRAGASELSDKTIDNVRGLGIVDTSLNARRNGQDESTAESG